MKIGILGCFFDCADDLEEVLAPWKAFSQEGYNLQWGASEKVEFNISSVHCQFAEYKDEEIEDKKTLEKSIELLGQENVFHPEERLKDAEARNLPLKHLIKQGCNLIWIVDGDEFYTRDQIIKTLNFVKQNDLVDWYKINFKNYVFDGKSWIDGFCPPRIFWTERNGGIDKFYWDNDIIYNNGQKYTEKSFLEVPKALCHVRHMTWLDSNGKAKYEYQIKHHDFGQCSYKWNYEKEKLEFNLDFYSKNNIPLPTLNKDD